MGYGLEQDKFVQQKHRDLVNEMYQQQIGAKLEAETKLLPKQMQLKLAQLSNQARGALQKDLEFLVRIGYDSKQLQKYINSKMGDLGKFDEYVKEEKAAGRTPKSYEVWDIARRRAGAMSIGQAADKAGATTGARKRAEMREYLLGPEVLDDARKQAMKEIADSPSVDWIDATAEETEKALEDKMYKIITKKLEAFSEFKKVEPGRKDGKLGWIVTDSDGKEHWRSF